MTTKTIFVEFGIFYSKIIVFTNFFSKKTISKHHKKNQRKKSEKITKKNFLFFIFWMFLKKKTDYFPYFWGMNNKRCLFQNHEKKNIYFRIIFSRKITHFSIKLKIFYLIFLDEIFHKLLTLIWFLTVEYSICFSERNFFRKWTV